MGGEDDELQSFAARVQGARRAAPEKVLRAGMNLVDGALRLRSGVDGIYGDAPRPVTKPAEAVRAWLRSMEPAIRGGSFDRHHELREALVAAGEEVSRAAATPAAARLRRALYSDAIEVLGGDWSKPHVLPWVVAASLGGVVVGMLLTRNRRSSGRSRRKR